MATRKRGIYSGISVFLLSYIFVSGAAAVFVAEGALHPVRRALSQAAERREIARIAPGASLRDVSVSARDGAVLRAWFLHPREAGKNTDAIILLHGLGDNRLGMAGYADLFLEHGYAVLMPDARAHGLSGGDIATYGLLEADDIERWFDWISTAGSVRCIYAFGESMGAAELLQALPTASRFCAVAAEAPFSTFREIAYDRMGQSFHTGPWLGRTLLRPLVEGALLYSYWKYGVNLQRVSPEEGAAANLVPVFLIHGQNDNNIPIRHSRSIAAANHSVVLWEVARAGHGNAIGFEPEEFQSRLLAWFEAHSASPVANAR